MDFSAQLLELARTADGRARLRYAPTPSGLLHRGNAFNFILNYLVGRSLPGNRLLLRIDDLDASRKRPDYVEDIFRSLQWLGLDWDEGPTGPDDFEKNWSQYRRLTSYHQALDRLRATGLLFACAKSRRDLQPYGADYPAAFRDQGRSLDEADVAWRLRTPPGFALPDFVVRRRDGMPAYQLASVVDDLHFGLTHVIRGDDLRASTEAQRYLAACLGQEEEFNKIQFLHHPLITDAEGQKLSKSAGATSLQASYGKGEPPDRIFQELGAWLGWPPLREATAALRYFAGLREIAGS